jgi:hypothetical protein
MTPKLTAKQLALRDLEVARATLARDASLAAEDYSPKALVARSFERYRLVWVAGAVLAGLVALRVVMPAARGSHAQGLSSRSGSSRSGWMALLAAPLLAAGRKAAMNYGLAAFQSFIGRKTPPSTVTT